MVGLLVISLIVFNLYLFGSAMYMRQQARQALRHQKYLRWKQFTRRRY